MGVNLLGYSNQSFLRQPQTLVDAAQREKAGREVLLETMQPLAEFDRSIRTFEGCCAFAHAFDLDGEKEGAQHVEAFQR